MSTKIETIEQRRYDRLAPQILDHLADTSTVGISQVADPQALRAALRREARRRHVKILTRAPGDHFVLLVAVGWYDTRPELAQAHMRAAVEAAAATMDGRPHAPLVGGTHYVALGEVTA